MFATQGPQTAYFRTSNPQNTGADEHVAFEVGRGGAGAGAGLVWLIETQDRASREIGGVQGETSSNSLSTAFSEGKPVVLCRGPAGLPGWKGAGPQGL